jgi:murein endopeptidase
LATRLLPAVTGLAAVAVAAGAFFLPEAAERLLASPPAPPLETRDVAASRPVPDPRAAAPLAPAPAAEAPAASTQADRPESPAIAWRNSRAVGVPHSGELVAGVALPVRGADWVTWDPVLDRVPNRANRLYGTDALVRMVLDVIAAYRAAHPAASKVVVGDLSLSGGGEIDEHVSHENGLDVDVYYPRRDGKLRPPAQAGQVDLRLAQDLLDRFVAAGAQVVFVGYSTPFRGPRDVVVPYPNHDNHMHVRIGAPR